MERGLIDFAYIYGKLDPAKYIQLPLPSQDRWVVFMSKDDELARKEKLAPKDLWDKPLLVSRQSLSSGTHAEDLLKWKSFPNLHSVFAMPCRKDFHNGQNGMLHFRGASLFL